MVERDTIDGAWKKGTIENVIDFSAVGYVFGKTIYDYMNIPIGLIQCAQSGTLAEAWLDKKAYRNLAGLIWKILLLKQKVWAIANRPCNITAC